MYTKKSCCTLRSPHSNVVLNTRRASYANIIREWGGVKRSHRFFVCANFIAGAFYCSAFYFPFSAIELRTRDYRYTWFHRSWRRYLYFYDTGEVCWTCVCPFCIIFSSLEQTKLKCAEPLPRHKSKALRLSPRMIYRRLINLNAPEVREIKYDFRASGEFNNQKRGSSVTELENLCFNYQLTDVH